MNFFLLIAIIFTNVTFIIIYDFWSESKLIERKEMPEKEIQPPEGISIKNQEFEFLLTNAINSRYRQDRILWSIQSIFWASNGVFLIGLFQNGWEPNPVTGFTISFFAFLVSSIVRVIQKRALANIFKFEQIVGDIEESMNIPLPFRFDRIPEDVVTRKDQIWVLNGMRARNILKGAILFPNIIWLMVTFYFLFGLVFGKEFG